MARGRPWIASLCAALFTTGAAVSARADEDDAMRRVSFRVESDRQVANDWLRASLTVTDEDPDPAAVAQRVNEVMAWALEVARAEKRVKVQSGGYSTQPVYDKARIRRWRSTQQLWIESDDFDAVTHLVGKLQSRLQLQSLDFSVSPGLRRKVADELIEEALAAFKARAELVRKNLGAKGYAIVALGIDTPEAPRPPRPMLRAAGMADASKVEPAVEAGTSRISVHVNATIELE